MGQYYKVIVRKDGKDTVYDRKVEGNDGYVLAKLTEFCWCGNSFCRSLAQTLLDSPGKVCFVGDYAEKEECEALGFDYDAVWGENVNNAKAPAELLDLAKVAYLVNGDKRQYVSLAKYAKASTDGDGWLLFPLGLLTALGNGRGGGDYHKEDPLVGSWAFDSVYFTNAAPPGDYEEIEPVFIDN